MVKYSWVRDVNQIGFTCIGSDSVCSSRSAEDGQVWLYEFLRNGIIDTVVVLFSGLKRGASARARDLLFLRSSKRRAVEEMLSGPMCPPICPLLDEKI